MRLILKNELNEVFYIETSVENPAEGIDQDGSVWTLQEPPTNLEGEHWFSTDRGSAWRFLDEAEVLNRQDQIDEGRLESDPGQEE